MKQFLKTEQIVARGWTTNMVKRLLVPDKEEEYRANGWDVKRHLYLLQKVVAKERSKAFRAAKELNEKVRQSRTPEAIEYRRREQIARLERKYENSDAALPDACEAMFHLNHDVKHLSCKSDNREAIYELKHGLIRILYAMGFCTDCIEHKVPGDQCYGCRGSGQSDYRDQDDLSDGEMDCNRCGGTGWWREPSVLVFFRFFIANKHFSWHVPADCLSFNYETTSPAAPWKPRAQERLVRLSASRFAQAKALIAWVIKKKRKTVIVKERTARNLAYKPAVNWPHGESLEEKLLKLGHARPNDAACRIRRGSLNALEVFSGLRTARRAAFKKRLVSQLAWKRPLHRPHGKSLNEKLQEVTRRGTPYRNIAIAHACAKIRSRELTFHEACAALAKGGANQSINHLPEHDPLPGGQNSEGAEVPILSVEATSTLALPTSL